jgi:predicted nucleotidyltransferase
MSQKSRHRKAFEEFAEEAQDELGESLKKLILYGSVARGEEDERSDVDIYAVVETNEQKRELEDLAFDFGIDRGLAFSPNVKTVEEFENRKNHHFTRTVLEEGENYA